CEVAVLAHLLPLTDAHRVPAVLGIGRPGRAEHAPLGVGPRMADECVDLFLGEERFVEAPAALKRSAGWEVANNGAASGLRGRRHGRCLLLDEWPVRRGAPPRRATGACGRRGRRVDQRRSGRGGTRWWWGSSSGQR